MSNSTQPLRIFIGYDPTEAVAYHVLCHSLLSRATQPLAITPLSLRNLQGIFNRPRDPLQSTDFAFTRFLVPYLCGYEGWALYMDCDMLCRTNISLLFDEALSRCSMAQISCVQHSMPEQVDSVKFNGARQTWYPRKNWSSLMMFNCYLCYGLLTPDYVASAPGLDLHQMRWTGRPSGRRIGALDPKWNHLVDVDAYWADAAIAHFTLGGPWHGAEYDKSAFAQLWYNEYLQMCKVAHT